MENKKIVIISCLVLLAIAIFIFVGEHCNNSARQLQGKANLESNILDVDNLAADPSAYSGKITVKGVVSFVYPIQNNFVIIDLREYDMCGVVTCAINHLTISYSKQLPKVKDRVEITGELVKTNKGYVLNAEDVKIK